MSLAFQNAEYVKQAIFEELQNLLSSDKNVLNLAEERMKKLEYTEGYGVYLSELIMNQSFDLPMRQIAGIMLTRYVESFWVNDKVNEEEADHASAVTSDQAKRAIRNILPNGLYDPNSKIRLSVAHTISTIAASDWPYVWTELFDIIIKCLGGNEDSIHGAMQILKEFTYNEKQIKELGPVVISEVYRIFESEQNYSIKTRTSAIRILKPLLQSIAANIKNKKEQSTMIKTIIQTFMDKLIHYLSINSGSQSSFWMRTEILKLLTLLVMDMPKYILPYVERILPVIWQLLTQIADTYVKVFVNKQEPSPFAQGTECEEDDEHANFTTMIAHIFEMIQCITEDHKFMGTIKSVLTDLIYIVIVFIQAPEDQIEDWNDDPEAFIDDESEGGGIEVTIRSSGQEFLMSLLENVDPLPALQEALRRHFAVAEAEKEAGNPYWWKIYEACMLAVHCFRELVIQFEDNFDLLNYLELVRSLLQYSIYPILMGRALWTLSIYSKSKLYNLQMLDEILRITLQSITPPDTSILLKIGAVRTIHDIVEAYENVDDEKHVLVQTKLPEFVNGIMDMVPGCNTAVLTLILETLTIVVNFELNFAASVQDKLIPLVIAVHLKYPEDPYVVDVNNDLLKAIVNNPMCIQGLQNKFLPVIDSILSSDKAPIIKKENALDALTLIVKHSTAPLPNDVIERGFAPMIQCTLRSDDNSIMVGGGECLRAFIFISPEQIASFRNGEGLNYVIQLTTMLLNPMNNEMTAGLIGRLVITIIVKMGNMLGENIDQLLKAVISKMQLVKSLKVTMSLVVIFAHLFLTQMDAVLNFLSTVPGPTGNTALEFIFHIWLTQQTSFYGAYERKVTTLALCKIFEYGIRTQDARLTAISISDMTHYNTDRVCTRSQKATVKISKTPALVNIFKLLIKELIYLREINAEHEETDTEDDEAESDDNCDNVNNTNVAISPNNNQKSQSTIRYVSDLYCNDEMSFEEDDNLITELMKDPLFPKDMQSHLKEFLHDFSTNEHYTTFTSQLTELELNVLKTV